MIRFLPILLLLILSGCSAMTEDQADDDAVDIDLNCLNNGVCNADLNPLLDDPSTSDDQTNTADNFYAVAVHLAEWDGKDPTHECAYHGACIPASEAAWRPEASSAETKTIKQFIAEAKDDPPSEDEAGPTPMVDYYPEVHGDYYNYQQIHLGYESAVASDEGSWGNYTGESLWGSGISQAPHYEEKADDKAPVPETANSEDSATTTDEEETPQ